MHEFLFQKGRESTAGIVECKFEPPGVYYIRDAEGNLDRVDAKPHPFKHTASSLQAIGEIAGNWAGQCEVWVGSNYVVLKFGAEKEHTAALYITASDQMSLLTEWGRQKPAHTQQSLVSILRTTLRDALPSKSLLDAIKKVRFNQQTSVNGEVGHGRASLGKELMGEVTGSAAIPEYVTFNVPVFANPCFRNIFASIECAVEPDASSGQFRLTPLPGKIADAADLGQQAIVEELATLVPEGTSILLGSP